MFPLDAVLRLGVSRRGPSGLFCQTQGATERELPDREGKVGRAESGPGREKLEGQCGYTQRHRGSRSPFASPQRCVSRCPLARPLRRRGNPCVLRGRGGHGRGGRRPAHPAGLPRPTPSSPRAARSRQGSGRAAQAQEGVSPTPRPQKTGE